MPSDLGALYERLSALAARLVSDLAQRLADHDVVIFVSGGYIGQAYVPPTFMASVAAAYVLRRAAPDAHIALCGYAAVSNTQQYYVFDKVVAGDPEAEILAYMRSLVEYRRLPLVAVPVGLAALPTPDYRPFKAIVDELDAFPEWRIPIEGSRGCWWDRVARSGDPSATCHFCVRHGMNYEEQPAAAIVAQMSALSQQLENVDFQFTDSVLRATGVFELASAIERAGKPFRFFYDARASVSPYELLRLWEAGLSFVQIGIEGLSTAYLQRLGKGTTTMMNLQLMKTCYELGIWNVGCNLMIGFPGTTVAEVAETVENIDAYALGYQPLTLSSFRLLRGTTVHVMPEAFGVSNIRNRADYTAIFLEPHAQGLALLMLEYDAHDSVDWTPVCEAAWRWAELHLKLRQSVLQERYYLTAPIYYRDCGDYLLVMDRRHGDERYTLRRDWRSVYLECMASRRRSVLECNLAGQLDGDDSLDDILAGLVAARLMFREVDRYLSLAVATAPHIAAARIRASWENDRRRDATAPDSAATTVVRISGNM